MATAALLLVSAVMANLAASHVKSTLVEAASQSNTIAAERVAGNVHWLLRDLSRSVMEVASDEDVRTLLRNTAHCNTRHDVQRFLRSDAARHLHAKVEDRFNKSNEQIAQEGIPEFATMFFLNNEGRLVDYVATTPGDPSITGEAFDNRDYFVVAKRHRNKEEERRGLKAVHVSRVFKSNYDGLFKFAISLPVADEDGSFLGVVEASIPMHHTLGLREPVLHGESQKAVLVGRVDQGPPTKRDGDVSHAKLRHTYQIQLHELFEEHPELRQREAPLFPRRPWPDNDPELPELGESAADPVEADDQYVDPLARHDSVNYGGRWLAGFAPVGNTELMVVVQQRYDEAVGQPTSIAWTFVLLGWGALAMASILVGAAVWHRSRRKTDKQGR
jgi:hypothetical protein